MTANRLNQGQSYKLVKWVEENRDDVKSAKAIDPLAERATADLGFKVTGSNVRTTAKTLGIERPTRNHAPAAIAPDPSAIEQLAIGILSLADAVGLDPTNRAALAHLAGGDTVLVLEQKA